MKQVQIKKGDTIIHKGRFLKMLKDFKINALESYEGNEDQDEFLEVKGSSESDPPIPVDLKTVINIVEKEIQVLLVAENKIVTGGIDDDALMMEEMFLEDNSPLIIDSHLEVSAQIMQMNKVLKKLKTLQ